MWAPNGQVRCRRRSNSYLTSSMFVQFTFTSSKCINSHLVITKVEICLPWSYEITVILVSSREYIISNKQLTPHEVNP